MGCVVLECVDDFVHSRTGSLLAWLKDFRHFLPKFLYKKIKDALSLNSVYSVMYTVSIYLFLAT
jgi:hypothetical protein